MTVSQHLAAALRTSNIGGPSVPGTPIGALNETFAISNGLKTPPNEFLDSPVTVNSPVKVISFPI